MKHGRYLLAHMSSSPRNKVPAAAATSAGNAASANAAATGWIRSQAHQRPFHWPKQRSILTRSRSRCTYVLLRVSNVAVQPPAGCQAAAGWQIDACANWEAFTQRQTPEIVLVVRHLRAQQGLLWSGTVRVLKPTSCTCTFGWTCAGFPCPATVLTQCRIEQVTALIFHTSYGDGAAGIT